MASIRIGIGFALYVVRGQYVLPAGKKGSTTYATRSKLTTAVLLRVGLILAAKSELVRWTRYKKGNDAQGKGENHLLGNFRAGALVVVNL